MTTKQKLLATGLAILLLGGICLLGLGKSTTTKQLKQIHIVIDGEQSHIDTTIKSDSDTLAELLLEQKEWNAVMENGAYGNFLTSLLGEAQDLQQGPWWLYSSSNNRICLEHGMCPALDQVLLEDGDAFHFQLTSDI